MMAAVGKRLLSQPLLRVPEKPSCTPCGCEPYRHARYQRGAASRLPSEEVRLLHDAEELFLVHLAVAVAVGLIDHFLQLLIGHPFSEFLGHALEILEGDLSRLVVVEEAEGFPH